MGPPDLEHSATIGWHIYSTRISVQNSLTKPHYMLLFSYNFRSVESHTFEHEYATRCYSAASK